jgi:hypothetical protein
MFNATKNEHAHQVAIEDLVDVFLLPNRTGYQTNPAKQNYVR